MSGRGEVIVRDARAEERGTIRAVTLAAYAELEAVMAPPAWRGLDAAVRAALGSDAPAERIVAEVEGRVVGSVMLFPAESDAYRGAAARASWPELRLLAVDPAARGRGIGHLLVEECIRRARAAGAPALGLHTSKSMAVAIRMYERMGFVRDPERDFQPEGAERVVAYVLPVRGDEVRGNR